MSPIRPWWLEDGNALVSFTVVSWTGCGRALLRFRPCDWTLATSSGRRTRFCSTGSLLLRSGHVPAGCPPVTG